MDPGTTNLGLCLFDMESRKVVRAATYNLASAAILRGDPCLTIRSTATALRTFLAGDLPSVFVCEGNLGIPGYKAVESQVDGALGFFAAFNIRLHCARPVAVRKYFGFANHRNRTENKKDTKEFLKVHGWPQLEDTHQRDALMLAIYFVFSQDDTA